MQIVSQQPVDGGRIVRLAFWAAPHGGQRTIFGWSPSPDAGLPFSNLANDYPQRIRYWREGRDLLAEIAMGNGSKGRCWRYGSELPLVA
jgi:hypothetical protein